MLFKTAQWRNEVAIAESGKAGNAHVNPHRRGGCGNRWFYFTFGLNAGKPLAIFLAEGDIFGFAYNVAAVAIAHPAQLGQLDEVIHRIDIKTLRNTETFALPS